MDIAVIGGGAAGLAAAIAAGEVLRGHGGRVVLCEASDRVGRSILATGNGRCNFSNAQLTRELSESADELKPFYRNAGFVAQVFAALEELSPFRRDAFERVIFLGENANAVLRFFADHGLVWREEGEGRLYPLANKASSVLDVLRGALEAAGVEVLTEFAVQDIARHSEGDYLLKAEDGRKVHASRVVIALGGSMNERLANLLGLPFVEQRPVLGPLAVSAEDKRVTKRLDNIRVKAHASLLGKRGNGVGVVRHESGEVLFRPYGLSGIVIFDLSRDAQPGDRISLRLLPPDLTGDVLQFLEERAVRLRLVSGKVATYEALLCGLVLPQVAQVLAERAQVKLDEPCCAPGVERLASVLFDWRFTVEDIGDARQCQVKRGGVAVEALAAETLEALATPGVHVAGEALDVDAACGGFNLHWAWASGLVAGSTAARAVLRFQRMGS